MIEDFHDIEEYFDDQANKHLISLQKQAEDI